MHVDVGSQSRVVGEIPAVVVGVFVDNDLVAVPEPATAQGQVKRGNAEGPAAEPETAGAASAYAPDMAATEAAGEAAVLPGMIEVKAGIVAPGVVAHPRAVVVNVRSIGMAFAIAIRSGRGPGGSAVNCWRAMVWDVSATDGMSAPVTAMLGESREGKNK